MIVKELFLSVGFDNILKALRNTHRNDRSIEGVVAYKEAFDIICLTEFEGDGGEVSFDVTPREKWSEPHALPLIANNVEGDYWKNTVGKTVVKPKDNPFTDAELAGAILWGMTFYGFTRHAEWSPHEERFTSFGERAERLERRLYLSYIRDKREKRKLKSKEEMPYGIAFSMEIWDRIHHSEKHQNRSKRKRYYRLKKRIAELKRLDKRQHLIDMVHEKCGFQDPQLECRIMTAGSIHETWRDSHVVDLANRTNYLEGLLTNYFPTFRDICGGGEELLIVAYTSETTPLTDEEERYLRSMINSFEPKIPITFIKGIDNEAKTDIVLHVIIISSKPINDDDDD
ncbi:hypothetical protein [Bacteroides acidifaciens]|jgi:hypothetical protein|uniref:hypothetical protein n=1 Tax=Bacteroides acidifaciens TaxID=85831 RepID=UPI002557D11C|nr:hypothetical protein [Bacteroides acidifaciens]